MTFEQLEHAIRAACDVAGDSEVWVFGSQAVLAEFPEAAECFRASIEVDMQPRNHPRNVDLIDGALGELSQFHSTHGFYVHGVSIDAARLPEGWEARVRRVCHPRRTRGKAGLCVEIHDLAASKIAAFRPKDRDFVRNLLIEAYVRQCILRDRIRTLPCCVEIVESRIFWLDATLAELGLAAD